jgi:hypothetical protein
VLPGSAALFTGKNIPFTALFVTIQNIEKKPPSPRGLPPSKARRSDTWPRITRELEGSRDEDSSARPREVIEIGIR